MQKNHLIFELIKVIRRDPSVQDLQKQDPKTEIYTHKLTRNDLEQLNQEYPLFLSAKWDEIYSINVISSKMSENSRYKKIRFYIAPTGDILKKIES